jgi:dihydroorotase
MLDLIIKNGKCYIDGELKDVDVAIKDGKIHKIGQISDEVKETINAVGQTVLPGCIDTQTHFREPGSTDTEDLHSGSRAAIVGGITSVFEMPNTNPPTSTKIEFQKKLDLAKNRMFCNYAFYFGATADNGGELAELENLEGCCGIKLFAGSSTGNLLVADEEDIDKVFKNSSKVVAVHSEDEATTFELFLNTLSISSSSATKRLPVEDPAKSLIPQQPSKFSNSASSPPLSAVAPK